jgi:hypothetical protein
LSEASTGGSSEASTEARRGRLIASSGWILTTALLVAAAALHRGLAPAFKKGPAWIRPSGWAVAWIPDELGMALALTALPAIAVATAAVLLTRSALARTLAVTAVIAVIAITFYGVQAPGVWEFFHWRWSAVTAVFAVVVGIAGTAPLLGQAWMKLPVVLRVLVYAPFFLLFVALERNITGTDPALPFAISPWPVVQVFGLEVISSWLAALQLGVGIGLLGMSRGIGPGLGGAFVAVSFPAASLWLEAQTGLLPFGVGVGTLAFAAVSAALVLAAAALTAAKPDGLASRGRTFLLGAVLLAAPLLVGQALAAADYSETRDVRAEQLVDALAASYEANETYPDKLEDMVAAGLLEEVPKPRVGFGGNPTFNYQNFGDSYLIEFSAVRWIQCAYSPPWPDMTEEDLEEGEDLGGSWSCPSKPPELW